MIKDLEVRYANPELQKKWEQAVAWLRTTKNGWVLDKVVERKSK